LKSGPPELQRNWIANDGWGTNTSMRTRYQGMRRMGGTSYPTMHGGRGWGAHVPHQPYQEAEVEEGGENSLAGLRFRGSPACGSDRRPRDGLPPGHGGVPACQSRSILRERRGETGTIMTTCAPRKFESSPER